MSSSATHTLPQAQAIEPPSDLAQLLIVLSIGVGLSATGVMLCLDQGLWAGLPRLAPTWLLALLWAWACAALVMLSFKTALWLGYRPAPALTYKEAPTLSVIIPAYNEGAMVLRSIESVAQSSYPVERLELYVIDDGSSDDTWDYIQRAQARYGKDLITAVRFPRNQGKRAALLHGFARARGELFVTIDSDSVIEHDALRAIAAPFADAHVGAVAGRVDVYNRSEGVLPRMLQVMFRLSFDFERATQSRYGAVNCCPGALTAFRRGPVLAALPGWSKQTFLGVPCATGEDRAMTNDVLAQGYQTRYQGNAVVRTLVPVTHQQLSKMLLRWDRSYVREELRFMRILWGLSPAARLISAAEVSVRNLGLVFRYVGLALLLICVARYPALAFAAAGIIASGAALRSLYYLGCERSTTVFFGVLYSFYFVFGLSWIFPWACLTARRTGWLTR